MDGLAQRKQRSNSLKHSQDPRKVVMAKHGQQGSKDGLLRTKDNVCEPERGSLAFVVLPPLKNKPKAPSITTTSFSGLPAIGNVRRRTTTSLDYPLHSTRKPSRDRQHLCSPTRRNNPQPDGLVYQSPYNRHSKAYEIWVPNQLPTKSGLPKMVQHLIEVNFSCKHSAPPSSEKYKVKSFFKS